jgi:polygalacturonase
MPGPGRNVCCFAILALLIGSGFVPCFNSERLFAQSVPAPSKPAIGVRGPIGPSDKPEKHQRLSITRSGVYQNMLIDGRWVDGNLVKINADNVTLRNSEIRNGRHNGITVYGRNVTIEKCRIHHLLKGTFEKQDDAHGITGRPRKLTIRDCEISYVSGDAVQFDPGRGAWDNVVIENCTFFTGPLKADAAGFKQKQRPGENAVDTKSLKKHPRAGLLIRNCIFYGWGNGQITNQAALNLKENIKVTIENCVFADNDIAFRLRGDTGERGGALVTIRQCAIYKTKVGLRIEDRIRDLKVFDLAFGQGVDRKVHIVGRKLGAGYINQGQWIAPPYEKAIKFGLKKPIK